MEQGGTSNRDQALNYLREGDYPQGIEILRDALLEDPTDVDLLLYLALAYAKTNDLERSIEVLEHAIDVAPTNAKVHYNLGIAYQRSHNNTLAKDEFLRALGLDPGYGMAKQALDQLTKHQGDQSADV